MSLTTARGVDYGETGVLTRAVEVRTHVLSPGLDVLREVAEWMDRQRAVWGRFMDDSSTST